MIKKLKSAEGIKVLKSSEKYFCRPPSVILIFSSYDRGGSLFFVLVLLSRRPVDLATMPPSRATASSRTTTKTAFHAPVKAKTRFLCIESRRRFRSLRRSSKRRNTVTSVALLSRISAEEMRAHLHDSKDLWSTTLHQTLLCNCIEGEDDESDCAFHFQYMPMRNRIEVPRMLCEARKCKYALELVGFVPWSDVKITTPYGKTPTLKNYDKTKTKDLAHEKPIARYLASKLQFFGRDEDERAKIDEVYEQHWSTLRNNGLTHQGENFDMDLLLAITDREIDETPRFQDMRRVNSFSPSQRSLASLRVFDEILLQHQSMYLVGDALSLCDITLFETAYELFREESADFDIAERFNLKYLERFLAHIEDEHPTLREYMKSARRVPRYKRPGYVYINE